MFFFFALFFFLKFNFIFFLSSRIGRSAGLGSEQLQASLVYLLKSFDSDQVLWSLLKKFEIKSVWLTTLIAKALLCPSDCCVSISQTYRCLLVFMWLQACRSSQAFWAITPPLSLKPRGATHAQEEFRCRLTTAASVREKEAAALISTQLSEPLEVRGVYLLSKLRHVSVFNPLNSEQFPAFFCLIFNHCELIFTAV